MNHNLALPPTRRCIVLRTFGLVIVLATNGILGSAPLVGQGAPDRETVLAQLKQALSDTGGDVAFADPEKSYAVSPDGRYFAGTLKSKAEIVSVVMDLQQKRTLSSLWGAPIENPTFSPGNKWVAFGAPSGRQDVVLAAVVDLASGQLTVAAMNARSEQQGPLRWRDAATVEFSFKIKEAGPGHCVWEVDHQAGRCEVAMALQVIDVERMNKGRIAADEAAAVAFLRTVNTAAVTYSSTYNVGYPKSLAAMGESPNGTVTQEHAGLIDKSLASGKKAGYTITYRPASATEVPLSAYTAVARPVQYGKSGIRSFFTDPSGVIRETREDREPTVNDPPVGTVTNPSENEEAGDTAANQARAVGALRTVNTAAVTYASTYNVGYPKSLAVMGVGEGAATQDHAGLIDKTLASGKKSGYTITYRPGPVTNGRIDTYTVVARPVQYGKTGTRNFFTDQSGVIRVTDQDREPTVNDPPIGG